jgi:hypothetical protein
MRVVVARGCAVISCIQALLPGVKKSGRAMNPYEATLPNILARIAAWVRGLLRRYRKPLLVMGAAGATVAISLGATQAPAMHHSPAIVAAR